MGSLLQFALLFVCWLGALATLLIFLETWFGLPGRNRFLARRASGAYGVISVFVPMQGASEKVERAIRSIFEQSYPFIELVLIHYREDRQFAKMVREFRTARSHIPVRAVPTSFSIDSRNDRFRALELAHGAARGRWFVVMDSDRYSRSFCGRDRRRVRRIERSFGTGSRPGIRCRSSLQRIIAPSMEQLLQMVRIATRRRDKRRGSGFRLALRHHQSRGFRNRKQGQPHAGDPERCRLEHVGISGGRTPDVRCRWIALDLAGRRCPVLVVQHRSGTALRQKSAGFVIGQRDHRPQQCWRSGLRPVSRYRQFHRGQYSAFSGR